MGEVDRLRLRMPLLARISAVITVFGFALWILTEFGGTSLDATAQFLVLVLVAAVAVLAGVRLVRLGVDATPETITVRGYGPVRHIPIRSITDVRQWGMPRISWLDAAGHAHVTNVQALRSDAMIGMANRHGTEAAEELVEWIKRHRRAAAERDRQADGSDGGGEG
ncbi:MAG TPA: hypothetical protein VHZ97_17650 [Pseudonocardiaceae bacterium]|jgi:hypothetical protein|nr:hypothetical protein [Pseudonocardiaceae bacterium]